MQKLFAALAALIIFAQPANAAKLIINSNGQLIGADSVEVGGKFYSVRFSERSCAIEYSGCNEDSDFIFQTEFAARLAAQSLLDQVFIDGPIGLFDSVPGRTFGCFSNVISCFVTVPFSGVLDRGTEGPTFPFAYLRNSNIEMNDSVFSRTSGIGIGRSEAFSESGLDTLAVFTIGPPIPEPSSWMMMIVGIAALGAALRRARDIKTQAIA